MNRRYSAGLLFLFCASLGFGQDVPFEPVITVSARPTGFVPMPWEAFAPDVVTAGFGGDLLLEYRPAVFRNLHVGWCLGYDYRQVEFQVEAPDVGLRRIRNRIDLGVSFGNLSGIHGGVFAGIGVASGRLVLLDGYRGEGVLIAGGGRLAIPLTGRLSLIAQLELMHDNNIPANDLAASIGLGYSVRREIPGGPFRTTRMDLIDLFPSLYHSYSADPVGVIELANVHDAPAHDVAVTVSLPEVMDEPFICAEGLELASGESIEVELRAPLNDSILEQIAERSLVATVHVSAEVRSKEYDQEFQALVTILGKNAIDWSRTETIGAFITPRDEALFAFAREVNAATPLYPTASIDSATGLAIAVIETMRHLRFRYVTDPNTPFTDIRFDRSVLDTVLFPRQTIEVRAGDCDDFTVLFCSVMESLGVETAVITVPGHILPAVRVGDSTAGRSIVPVENLILAHDTHWLPVETTLAHTGFENALQRGRELWDDHDAAGEAELHPIHEAWQSHPPASLPQEAGAQAIVADAALRREVEDALERFVRSRIEPAERRLRDDIREEQRNPALRNRLGVLYARSGLLQEAADVFVPLAESDAFVPAMINLGSVYHLQRDYDAALPWLEQALRHDSGNPRIRVVLARVYHALGRYASAADQHEQLAAVAPELAASIAHVSSAAASDSRASAMIAFEHVWEEE